MEHRSCSRLSPELGEKMVVGFWDGWSLGSAGWGCLPGVGIHNSKPSLWLMVSSRSYGGIQLLDLTLWASRGKRGDKGRENAMREISLPFNFSWHKLKIFLGGKRKDNRRSWLLAKFDSKELLRVSLTRLRSPIWCSAHAMAELRACCWHRCAQHGRCVQGPGPISSPAEQGAAAGEWLGCREAQEMFDGSAGVRWQKYVKCSLCLGLIHQQPNKCYKMSLDTP